MCLVIFWLVAQDYFKEMTDNDVRKRIYEEQKNQIEQDMAPFGFISDGINDGDSFVIPLVIDGILMNMVICHTCDYKNDGNKKSSNKLDKSCYLFSTIHSWRTIIGCFL